MIRRVTIGFLSFLLTVSVVGWIVHFPTGRNPLRAVPINAQLVFHHDQPEAIRPFIRSSDRLYPTDGAPTASVSQGWKTVLQVFEHGPLAVATVPLHGLGERDSRMIVSIPRFPLLLRWKLLMNPPANVSLQRSYAGHPVWRLDDPAFPAWVRIRFSIAKGVLICSVSQDSHDIYYLLDTADGRSPAKYIN